MEDKKVSRSKVTSPTKHFLKSHIDWSFEQRALLPSPSGEGFDVLRSGINYSICLESAIYTEACLQFGLNRPDFDSLQLSTFQSCREYIKPYKDFYKVDFCKLHSWEAVDALQELRNVLSHGDSLRYDIELDQNLNETGALEFHRGKYEKIWKFLKKNKKWSKSHPQPSLWYLLEDSVANWAWETSKSFLEEIYEKLDGDHRSIFGNAIRLHRPFNLQ